MPFSFTNFEKSIGEQALLCFIESVWGIVSPKAGQILSLFAFP